MHDVERTVNLFANGLNCSQAMLTVFGERYGLDPGTAIIVGRPLGGGMGRMARTCGAVAAAVIVLGLARDHPDEAQARKASYALVQELFTRFEHLHGTTDCRTLLGADMSTEEGMRKIKEQGLFQKRCPAFVRNAAAILEELLASESEGSESMAPERASLNRVS